MISAGAASAGATGAAVESETARRRLRADRAVFSRRKAQRLVVRPCKTWAARGPRPRCSLCALASWA